MPVIDVIYDKLEVNRTNKRLDIKKEIQVSNNFGLKEVSKQKLPGAGDCAIVSFEYKTDYEPDMGNIVIQGRVVYHEKNIKDAIKEEKGNVILKQKPLEEVNNAILRSSTIQALLLAKEMRLPLPLQLPKVSIESAKKKK